jgi:hypothetical protein
MTKQITTYTANVTGISASNVISSASEITARQNTSTAINNTGEVVAENRELLEAIHTTDHIINVTSTSFSGGTNELSILANAITWWDESVYRADKTADAALTGWPAKTITGLTTSNTFYIWATFVSGTKDYEATNITAALPSNITEKALIGIATVSGAGAVTFAVNWQGSVQTRENYFRDAQYFLNSVNIKGNATFQGQVFNILPPFYHDMQIEYLTVSTIRIKADSRCRSADNTKDVIFTSDYTVDMSNATPTSTTGGRTVAEASSTTYYLYVGLTSGNLPLAWLDTADLSAGGTPTNPAAYASGRRQVLVNGIQDEQLVVYNNSSSNIDYIGGSLIVTTNGNGRGSTNTCINRFSAVSENIGSSITYADSATLGALFTINKSGFYFISYTHWLTAINQYFGISRNSTQLSTNIPDITQRHILANQFNSADTDTVSVSSYLQKGDLIRPHTSGNSASAANTTSFRIARTG